MLDLEWKNDIIRLYGNAAAVVGKNIMDDSVIVPFTVGVESSFPVYFANRRVSLCLEGGIDSDKPNMITATLDDYCGSSWDYDRVYHHQDSGLLFSEYFQEGGGEHAIYCYHRRDPLYFRKSCSVTYRSCQGAPVTEFVEWYSADESRLKAISCDQLLDDIRRFISKGGGKPSDFVEFYTNDNLYSVAYYYLDRP